MGVESPAVLMGRQNSKDMGGNVTAPHHTFWLVDSDCVDHLDAHPAIAFCVLEVLLPEHPILASIAEEEVGDCSAVLALVASGHPCHFLSFFLPLLIVSAQLLLLYPHFDYSKHLFSVF